MANLTSIGVTNGIPTSGTGTVSTIDALLNSLNANLNVDPAAGVAGHFGAPVVPLDYYSQYKAAPASATTKMGATGGQYDYLAGVLIIPTSSSCGAVSIQDGNGTAIQIFAGGGTVALADLKPFTVGIGIAALNSITPGWNIICGANVSAIGIGRFT